MLNHGPLASLLQDVFLHGNLHSIQDVVMQYNLTGLSMEDVLLFCCIPRCLLALYAVYVGSAKRTSQEALDRQLHPFASSITSSSFSDVCEDELFLEEPFCKWFNRFVSRSAFPVELFGVLNLMYLGLKAMARLYYEIHLEDEEEVNNNQSSSDLVLDEESYHPVWWASLAVVALFTTLEIVCIDKCCIHVATFAIDTRNQRHDLHANERPIDYNYNRNDHYNIDRSGKMGLATECAQNENENDLSSPLLTHDLHDDITSGEEKESLSGTTTSTKIESDIGSNAKYQAGWNDLISLCKPDVYLFLLAFVFLILAALMQVLIPQFTGNILDALAEYDTDDNESSLDNLDDIWQIPGFTSNIIRLIIAAIFCGLFSGIRYVICTTL